MQTPENTIQLLQQKIENLEQKIQNLETRIQFHENTDSCSKLWEIFYTPDAKIIYISKSFQKLTGYEADDLMQGKISLQNLVHSDDMEIYKKFEQGIIKQTEEQEYILRTIHKNKELKFITVNTARFIADQQQVKGMRAVFTDITELKKIEFSLRDKNIKINKIINNVPALIAFVNKNLEFEFANKRYKDFYNHENKELLGLTVQNLFGEEKFEEIKPHIQHVLSGNDVHFEVELKRPNQATIYFEVQLVPNVLNNEVNGYFAMLQDITERKNFELQILTNKERYKLISEYAYDWELYFNQYGKLEYCNATFESITGYKRNDLIDGKINLSDLIVSDFPEQVISVISGSEKIAESMIQEFKIKTKQGIEKIIESASRPVYTNQLYMGVRTSLRDITSIRIYENEIKHSEINFINFFNSIHEFLIILNKDYKILYNNHFVSKRLNYTNEEIQNMHFFDLLPRECKIEGQTQINSMLTGSKELCHIPYKNKYGENVFVESRIKMGKWNGEDAIFVISNDISELKLSEEKFSKAFQYSGNLMAITDFATGQILNINKACEYFFEKKAEELVGQEIATLNLLSEEVYQSIYSQIVEFESVNNIELSISVNAVQKYLLYSGVVIFLQSRKCWLSVMQDVTQLKRAQQELHESEEKWKFALEGVNDGLWDWNLSTNEVIRSQNWNKMLGFASNEVDNTFETWNKLLHPDDKVTTFEALQKHLSGETSFYSSIHRMLCKNGTYKWVLDRGKIFAHDTTGKPTRMIGVHSDYTERMEIENKLRSLNRDKDIFLSILAHDLRSPIATMLGYTNLLKANFHKFHTEKQFQFIEIISKITNQTFNLLDDLLMWSRIQSGKLNPEIQHIELDKLITSHLIFLHEIAAQKNISLQFHVPQNLWVSADENMLKTILRNLISNAIKFTPVNGHVSVNAEIQQQKILISVNDNGVGIIKEDAEKIWVSAKPHTTIGTSDEKGTGLGLLICKEFVEKLYGQIWFESEVNKGTTFFFTLPSASF